MARTEFQSTGPGRTNRVLPFVGLSILCCLLAAAIGTGYMALQPEPTIRPVVVFSSPSRGQQIAMGETVTVHAIATDPSKITRVELWIDGQLHEAQASTLPDGTSPFPLVVYWDPPTAGQHTLTARAFNSQGARAHASMTIETTTEIDTDGDGVPDDADRCPDEPGSRRADGCPDRDGDGIADTEDACPDEAGLPEGDGCPSPSEADRDGDGVPDDVDRCPDTPGAPRADGCPDGDGDGVPDGEDACPDERGFEESDGCPATDDSDGDGIPDDEDLCPDAPGVPVAEGCPDADADGTPDSEDACPEEPGPPEDGCPAPADTDRDGDGVIDSDDACPDEPGSFWSEGCPDRDGDGVRDSEDACPDEPGVPDRDGCPEPMGGGGDGGGDDGGGDRDGDGVPDDADPCPDEPGPPEHDGCPDSDGDGIPDWWDICPDEPGPPETIGCPEGADRDGDGVPDEHDPCPDEPGLPEHDGCPPPGEGGDDDGDGIPDDEEPPEDPWSPSELGFYLDDIRIFVPVEFQALTFGLDDNFDEVHCYASLAGSDMERYGPFEPLGERQWDIAAEMGSIHLAVPSGEPLMVQVECGGHFIFLGPEGGWGSYFDLGTFSAEHPPSDWDGHVISIASSGGDDGHTFQAEYRICAGTCEDAAFPPPVLSLLHGGGDVELLWYWEGDRESIDGFKVYMNGSYIFSLPPDAFSQSVLGYRPLCGDPNRREFQITAYQGDRESPLSNKGFWSSQPCPRVVRVTFDAFSTFHLGDDEWWAEGSVGPIYGGFQATGSTTEELDFWAVDYGDWWGERDRGYRLRSTRYYRVQDIFDWIQREMASCLGSGCPAYYGPLTNFVTVELGPRDDLTFGGRIRDVDSDNPDDTLFEGERTLASDAIVPGRYRIWDRNIELTVFVDVLVGPEAGDLPDLTVTGVSTHEESGQLRIHLFNNAAPLEDASVTVNLVRMTGNERIALPTWDHVTIPSGGSRSLQLSDPIIDPWDLRVIVDPDNAIPEMNDGNNIYETPVTMQVEFVRASAPNCNENGCSIFDCDSEHVFHVWAGHGLSGSDVTWVGYNVRFPASGELVACGHDICESSRSPTEDWYMEGDERYTFEFEMPANESLYVMVTGAEQDHTNMDDSLGRVYFSYAREMNYGARADIHEAEHGSETPCDDTFCIPCRNGLYASWRITRIR